MGHVKHAKRNKNKHYWIYGKHSVLSALRNPKRSYSSLLLTAEAMQKLEANNISLSAINYKILKHAEISQLLKMQEEVHQGIALEVEPLEQLYLSELLHKTQDQPHSILVLLDQITDPQNTGAIVRSATAFSADAVITTYDNAAAEGAALIKASAGTFEQIPFIQVVNLSQSIQTLKQHNYWVLGLSGHAKDSFASVQKHGFKKLAVIMGAEGKGLRKLTTSCCDFLVNIPISPKVESLNVASAAAIILHEIFKDQQS